jgi:hypothetical protein
MWVQRFKKKGSGFRVQKFRVKGMTSIFML